MRQKSMRQTTFGSISEFRNGSEFRNLSVFITNKHFCSLIFFFHPAKNAVISQLLTVSKQSVFLTCTFLLFARFLSNLSNRTQTVTVKRCSSAPVPVCCGVTQGYVLGPVFFVQYRASLIVLLLMLQKYAPPQQLDGLILSMHECIQEVKGLDDTQQNRN